MGLFDSKKTPPAEDDKPDYSWMDDHDLDTPASITHDAPTPGTYVGQIRGRNVQRRGK